MSGRANTGIDYWPPGSGKAAIRKGGLRIEQGLLVPMRDGTLLSLDLLRPLDGGVGPVVLVRTPYDKVRNHENPLYRSLVEQGYVVALQDTRGRFNSDGEFFPYMDEKEDGYDTVEWIAQQDWCDGHIGMAGRSYVGQTQWLAAATSPPHLTAIVPICSPPDLFFNEPIFQGAFLLGTGEWLVAMGRRSYQNTNFLDDLFKREQSYLEELPIAHVPRAAGTSSAWWDEMMRHPNLDDFWKRGSYQESWSRITVPALNITGWYDMNFPGAPTNFAGMRAHGGTEEARRGQKLVIGPWPHWVNQKRELNGIDFGDDALIDLDGYIARFYERWLKGVSNGIEDEKPVYVFVMGANEWWVEDDWPLPSTEYIPFYFHSNGSANTLMGDGVLSTERPQTEPPDTYTYNPLDPVRSLWNIRDGPVDDRIPSLRSDVLCYSSEVLQEPVDVVGPVSCSLFASSTGRDTDWHARLVDVYPDGSARFLCHGVLRARFRTSFERPELMEPGEIYCFRFGMDATGNRFLPGHRIRVEVTSSWFPRWDRNTNSGADNNFLDDTVVSARQTVYHQEGPASHVVLPVIRGRAAI